MAPPPELIDDAVTEILTRLPPDYPRVSSAPRSSASCGAALICKLWRRLLFDPAFLRRRHAFHRIPPPLLGFFYNVFYYGGISRLSRFVPTTSFRLPGHNSRDHVIDCRHGLALLFDSPSPSPRVELLVWDPMAGGRRRLRSPGFPFLAWNAAVLLAAAAGHDDDRLGGAPFLVVFAGGATLTRACVYASETGAWSTPTSLLLAGGDSVCGWGRQSVLVGEALYFLRMEGILQYDLGMHRLSALDLPSRNQNVALMEAEGGGLGVAGMSDSRSLYGAER